MENKGLTGLRYMIDFMIVPEMFVREPGRVLQAFKSGAMESFLCMMFNNVYKGQRKFEASQFKATKYEDGNAFVWYVTLPDEHEGSIVWCDAYGFAFLVDEANKRGSVRFLTVEKTEDDPFLGGTRMLCGVNSDMSHASYGRAMATDEENAEKMLAIIKPKPTQVTV